MESNFKPKQKSLILLVDDESDLRESIAELLQFEGYHVAEVSNGQEALDFLRAFEPPPCLVLLDIMMPVMGGKEFRKAQLSDPKIARIPIAVMTAGRLTSEVIQELAPQEIIKKPIKLEAFIETVHRYCGE